MGITEIVKTMIGGISQKGVLARFLPATLIVATAMCRPGLSAARTVAKIIENNKRIGINVGPNPDGSPNVINQHDYGIVKAIFDSLIHEGVIQVGIPANSLLIKGMGANAGGSVDITATNITNTKGYGIFGA